jgi:hypothetical protein
MLQKYHMLDVESLRTSELSLFFHFVKVYIVTFKHRTFNTSGRWHSQSVDVVVTQSLQQGDRTDI